MLRWGWVDLNAPSAEELLDDKELLLTTFSPLLRSVVSNPGTRILLVCSVDQEEFNVYAKDATKQKRQPKIDSDAFWQHILETFF